MRLRARQESRLRDLLGHRFLTHVDSTLPAGEFARVVDGIARREIDPYTAATDIMATVLAAPFPGAETRAKVAGAPEPE
jgi:hypothetical protein